MCIHTQWQYIAIIISHLYAFLGNEELATNWFFPSNFTQVKLLPPNIKASNFKQMSSTSATVSFITCHVLNTVSYPSIYTVHSVLFSCGSICISPNNTCWKFQVRKSNHHHSSIMAHSSLCMYMKFAPVIYSYNGFLMMPKLDFNVAFTSPANFSISDFDKQLLIRSNDKLTS